MTAISRRLSVLEKKEIFAALVETQDAVCNVPKSYEIVTKKFNICREQLEAIEEQGLDNEWPPLS